MKGFMRVGLLAGLAMVLAAPAEAQFLFGDGFWGAQQQRSAAPRRATRQQAAPQRRQQPRPAQVDDDDDDERPQVQRRSQPVAAARPGVRGPKVQDGGGRPAISAVTPPTVSFSGYAQGSVVIDTRGRALYYVLGGGRAYRYPIAVGREGFSWTGTQRVSRVASWPDWHPPAEMRERQPYLPEKMTGGIRNPLGAKAIYLGSTLYRIHGTNDSRSIGSASSSGCFRMTNGHVTHLASLVSVGAAVHVLRGLPASARRNIAERGRSAADRS